MLADPLPEFLLTILPPKIEILPLAFKIVLLIEDPLSDCKSVQSIVKKALKNEPDVIFITPFEFTLPIHLNSLPVDTTTLSLLELPLNVKPLSDKRLEFPETLAPIEHVALTSNNPLPFKQ